jgi:HEAT repeat protein
VVRGAGEAAQEARIKQLIGQLPGSSAEARYRAVKARDELIKIGRPAVPALIEATAHEDAFARSWAAAALGSIADPAAVPALTGLLKDQNSLVRCVAVWNLGAFAKLGRQGGDDPKLAEAIATMLQDPDADVKKWAYRSLTERALKASIPALQKALTADDPEARKWAFGALARLRGEAVLDAAQRSLKASKDAKLRQAAYGAVRDFGEAKVELVDMFLQALGEESAEIKVEGVLGIRWLLEHVQAQLDPAEKEKLSAALEAQLPPLLRSDYAPLRAHAMHLLVTSRKEKLLPELLDALKNDPAPIVRSHALRSIAVAGVKSPPVIDAIVEALGDGDAEVREWAYRAFRWATDNQCTLEFHPKGSAENRQKQAQALRDWWAAQRPRSGGE